MMKCSSKAIFKMCFRTVGLTPLDTFASPWLSRKLISSRLERFSVFRHTQSPAILRRVVFEFLACLTADDKKALPRTEVIGCGALAISVGRGVARGLSQSAASDGAAPIDIDGEAKYAPSSASCSNPRQNRRDSGMTREGYEAALNS